MAKRYNVEKRKEVFLKEVDFTLTLTDTFLIEVPSTFI